MDSRDPDSPAARAAQHLANLVGRPVAGFAPQPISDVIDVDARLAERNFQFAGYLVIGILASGSSDQRAKVLAALPPKPFASGTFHEFLLSAIRDQLNSSGLIDLAKIAVGIAEYELRVRTHKAHQIIWEKALQLAPTPNQLSLALDIVCSASSEETG